MDVIPHVKIVSSYSHILILPYPHTPISSYSHILMQSFAAEVWTGFLFRMKFVGVQLEFLQQRQTEVPGSLGLSLALFDIQDCEFSFESRSNQSKTVDFTTHAVIGYDTRYRGGSAIEPQGFMYMYMLMRDEEGRKKEASKVKQTTRQSNTAHANIQTFNHETCF